MGRTVFLKQGVSGEMYSKGIYSFEELMGSKKSVPPSMPKRMDRHKATKASPPRPAINSVWRKNFEKYKSEPTSKWSLDWIELQTIVKNRGKLNQEKINEFESIGVVLAESILSSGRRLRYGECIKKYISDPSSKWSKSWRNNQVHLFKSGLLSGERQKQLDDAGVDMVPKRHNAFYHAGAYKKFVLKHGRVPSHSLNAPKEENLLYHVCYYLRAKHLDGTLDRKEVAVLADAGIICLHPPARDSPKIQPNASCRGRRGLIRKNNEEHRKRHNVSYWAQAYKDFVALNGAPPHHKAGSEGKLYMACRNLRCKHLSGKLSMEEAAVLAAAGVI